MKLIYKSRPYERHSYGNMQLGLACSKSVYGPYVRQPEPLFPPAIHIEDPFVWRTARGYEMIAKDMDGSICGERYSGVHAWSANGEQWKMTTKPGEPVYSRRVRWDDGTERLMGNLERPFCSWRTDVRPGCLLRHQTGAAGFTIVRRPGTWQFRFGRLRRTTTSRSEPYPKRSIT